MNTVSENHPLTSSFHHRTHTRGINGGGVAHLTSASHASIPQNVSTDTHATSDLRQLRRRKFQRRWTTCVERSAAVFATRRQLWTVKATAENISAPELTLDSIVTADSCALETVLLT